MNNIMKRYSKEFMLIFSFIIISIVLASIITKNQLVESLMNAHQDKLTSLKHTLRINISNYIDEKSNIIKTISSSSDVKTALEDFSKAYTLVEKEFKEEPKVENLSLFVQEHLNKTTYGIPKSSKKKDLADYLASNKSGLILQTLYISNSKFKVKNKYLLNDASVNLSYNEYHKKYHRRFVDLIRRHNFYDIFLIDAQGNIVYTVFKELDLGTNLLNGVYKDSSLANAYKKSLDTQSLSFSDFKPYEPSHNKPAAFFSIAINENGKNIGAIAFQISTNEINNTMTFNKNWSKIGLGNTGESYLVGEDYLMRSDSRFLDKTIGILNVKSKPIEYALKKRESSGIFKDYRGIRVLSSYTYIDIFDYTWGIAVEVNLNEIYSEIQKYINTILFTGIVIIIMSILFLIYFFRTFIIEPVGNYEEALEYEVRKRTQRLNQLNKHLQDEIETKVNKIREKDKALLQQARMAALGEMAGNIAHQWRQPLSVISTCASSLEASIDLGFKVNNEQVKDATSNIMKQASNLSQTIEDFRNFILSDNSKKESINLKTIIEKCIDLIEEQKGEINFILSLEDKYLNLNENHIIHVLLNIIRNSIHALKQEDTKDKYIFITISSDKKNIIIEVKDTAFGIKEDMIDKIFDPYTTTKHQSVGTGLGLYMSYQIISTIYNGDIKSKNIEFEYENKSLKGASITIELPLQLVEQQYRL